jgi:hypothetical protein
VKQDAAKSDIYSKLYRGIRALMRKDENKDNLACASYCIDIALRFEPEGKYQKNWKTIRERPERLTGKT